MILDFVDYMYVIGKEYFTEVVKLFNINHMTWIGWLILVAIFLGLKILEEIFPKQKL